MKPRRRRRRTPRAVQPSTAGRFVTVTKISDLEKCCQKAIELDAARGWLFDITCPKCKRVLRRLKAGSSEIKVFSPPGENA